MGDGRADVVIRQEGDGSRWLEGMGSKYAINRKTVYFDAVTPHLALLYYFLWGVRSVERLVKRSNCGLMPWACVVWRQSVSHCVIYDTWCCIVKSLG